MTVITLTTDFGLRDGYIAAIKGVIPGINQEAKLVDVTKKRGLRIFSRPLSFYPIFEVVALSNYIPTLIEKDNIIGHVI